MFTFLLYFILYLLIYRLKCINNIYNCNVSSDVTRSRTLLKGQYRVICYSDTTIPKKAKHAVKLRRYESWCSQFQEDYCNYYCSTSSKWNVDETLTNFLVQLKPRRTLNKTKLAQHQHGKIYASIVKRKISTYRYGQKKKKRTFGKTKHKACLIVEKLTSVCCWSTRE